MIENPLVSIVLPTYNGVKRLERAVESAIRQTYPNTEIIIINDGSTDETAGLISRLIEKNPRIVALTHAKNLGIVQALNDGIARARGKYIARLDDDDTWRDDEKIGKQVRFLEQCPEYGLVGGGTIVTDSSGKEIKRYMLPEKDEDIRKVLLIKNQFVHPSVMFRKDIFEKAGGYREEFRYVEDWDLWLGIGRIAKFYNFPEFFVTYTDQEYDNPSHYRNLKIRRNIKMNTALRKKYAHAYPGYARAIMWSWLGYFYSFLPLRGKPIFARMNHSKK